MKTTAAILLFLLMAGSVSAIVVADYSIATNPPSGIWDLNWGYVYNYKGSSAVAVGSHWLLTAAHVANDGGTGTISVNGTNYVQQEIIFHAVANDPQHTSKADLALVRFDKPFPGYYPLYTETFPAGEMVGPRNNKVWQDYPCVMVGYGVTGTVYSTYYTPKAHTDSSKGTKRWGTQIIEDDATITYTVTDDPLGTLTNVVGFYMDFDLADSDYEAGLGSYDSGGGTFVKESGVWKLAGINTAVYRFKDATPSNSVDWIFSVSMPSYGTWITNMIAAADGDADLDGIPNWWEAQYSTNILASTDQDGDGVIGTDEYIADTNPTNPASFGLADTNLIWVVANTNKVWGAGTNSSITVTNADEKAFYRLRVSLP